MGNTGFRKIFSPLDVVETKFNSVHEINVLTLDKKEVSLSQYKDKVCLIVNTSSTSKDSPTEIKALKELHERYSKQGFEILAFPCNQFQNEHGNFTQIKQAYNTEFGVNFPVFAKVSQEYMILIL
jgi:glutathione peroxidase